MIQSFDLLTEQVQKLFPEFQTIHLFESSANAAQDGELVMLSLDGEDKLLLLSDSSLFLDAFTGDSRGNCKLCPLSHENRLALNKCLPFTVPTAVGVEGASIGLGDRLGLAGFAHLAALGDYPVKPVLAQQSIRELNFTHRHFEEVIDAAAWAVFKAGWRRGYAADGDHLKKESDIAHAVDLGISMLTLDCSDWLQTLPAKAADLDKVYEELPAAVRLRLEKEYLNDVEAAELGIRIDLPTLKRVAVIYSEAIAFAKKIYRTYLEHADRAIDFEISIDETEEVTGAAAHYFFARELHDDGVSITSMAPRFVGEFQKGIDYMGDIKVFEQDLNRHAMIAEHFGHRLSIHSGSDKFRIFPLVGRATHGKFHLKTAGTSWLEALRVIAEKNPVLFRKLYQCASSNLAEAKSYYVIQTEIDSVPLDDLLEDAQLPALLNHEAARQLLHVTYGFMWADEELKTELFATLKEFRERYDEALVEHIGRHISALLG